MAKAAFVACDRRQRCSQKMTFDARQRLSKVIKCGLSRAFTHAFDQRQRRFFVQCNASFFGVVVISVDRFLAIHFHLRYQELVTHKRVVAVVISLWVLSAALSVPWFSHDIHAALQSIAGIVCLLLTSVAYSRIYVVLRRHQNQIQAVQVLQVAQDGNEMANFASVGKSAVCTFYTYVVFLLCYLPWFSFSVALKVHGASVALKKSLLYSSTLVHLNSSLNPVIYCWKMRHIRRTVMDMLRNMARHRN